MPRNLSIAAKSYAGPIVWLADITLRDGSLRFFATEQVTYGGNSYQPFLRIAAGLRQTRALRPASAELELLATETEVLGLLQTEVLEGALCELRQLLLGIEEDVLLLRGRLTEQEESDAGLRFRLVSELDPAQLDLPVRRYSQLCTWRFSRPARLTPCGYNPVAAGDVTEAAFGERAAGSFSSTTIGDSALSETVNAHADKVVVITAGTGRGQFRRIRSNTATVFSLYHAWAATPDGASKFRVFDLPKGAPKLLLTASSGKLESGPSSAAARTLSDTTLAMATDEHAGGLIYIVSGTGAGQLRRIGSNTATVLTLEAAEPDFNPVPDGASLFRVLHGACPKDFAPSCETRARTQAFNGFPTLVPIVHRSFASRGLPRGFDPDRGGPRSGPIPIME